MFSILLILDQVGRCLQWEFSGAY